MPDPMTPQPSEEPQGPNPQAVPTARRRRGAGLIAAALAGTCLFSWAQSRTLSRTISRNPSSKTEASHPAKARAFALPDWQDVSAAGFGASAERKRLAWMAGGNGLTDAEVRAIAEHLDGPAETATRAAVLLGIAIDLSQSPSALATDLLIRRLKARITPASRSENGVDIVAARALAPHSQAGTSAAKALAALASGPGCHPDLAVRVESASVALESAGDWSVAPFLIAVLRAETPDESKSPRTWPRIQTLAWVKTRAAEALSRATGTEMRFRPDGPWAHQTYEASRLESLMAELGR